MKDINVLKIRIKDAYEIALSFGLSNEPIYVQRSYLLALKQIAITAIDETSSILNQELSSLKGKVNDVDINIDDILVK